MIHTSRSRRCLRGDNCRVVVTSSSFFPRSEGAEDYYVIAIVQIETLCWHIYTTRASSLRECCAQFLENATCSVFGL